jgi:dephospho-CoA kinase
MVVKQALQIGITGGIGSGKSLIARIFSVLGIPVYDADTRARWLMNYCQPLKKEIESIFGPESYLPNGTLNRPYMASQVFNDQEKILRINSLIHPRVGEDYNQWVLTHLNAPYVLKEAALLFESNSYRILNHVITVVAPIELRVRRVLQRDPHRTEKEVWAIIDKQMSEEDRQQRADFLIYNNDSQLVIPQVIALHQRFYQEAGISHLE